MRKTRLSRSLMCSMGLLLAAGALSAGDFSRAWEGYQVAMTRGNHIHFKLGQYRLGTVVLDGQTYTRIHANRDVVTDRKGYAELPFFHTAVQLSPDKKYRVVVENVVQEDVTLDYPMLPSRGTIYRNQDPNTIPYELAPQATREGFYPAELVTASEPFILRDLKGQNLYFHAVQYDAGTRTLRITKSMDVRLEEVENCNDECRELMTRVDARPAMEVDGLYNNLFLNYVPAKVRWPHELGEQGDILVLTTSAYKSAIQPYVDWKKKCGFKVDVKEVSKGANVKDTIKQAYNANKKLLYVQLVGGWADIKSPLGGGANKPMDPTLGWITDDNYAELIIGRFSAASAADVTAQVNKAMGYEKEPVGPWIKSAIGIASAEGAGKGDDGQGDTEHMQCIADGRLKPGGYTAIAAAHGKSASKSTVSSAWNKGVGVVNYVGHGSETAFVTTNFTTSDAAALTNGNKAPVVVSVACVNGDMTAGKCLAEAMLRNPKGAAVNFMGSTINQPWQPPMRGQDYFNDLLVGGHKYSGKEKGTDTDHGKGTYGSLAVNAHILMYAESSGNSDLQTIQTWTNFGDCSLRVRTPKNPNPPGNSTPAPSDPTPDDPTPDPAPDPTPDPTPDPSPDPTPDPTPDDPTPEPEPAPSKVNITSHPSDQSASVGSDVTFRVTASGGAKPYTYAWYWNNIKVSETSATFTFEAREDDNNAKIHVIVKDAKGSTAKSRVATVTVR